MSVVVPARQGNRIGDAVKAYGRTMPVILAGAALAALVVTALLALAFVSAIRFQRQNTQTIGRDSAPSIVAAQAIAATAADMDANAANYLIGSGAQNAAARKAFDDDVTSLSTSLVAAAENITYGDDERIPIRAVETGLQIYEQHVGSAIAIHDKGDAAGALAEYRMASDLMENTILPNARRLDAANRQHFDAAFGAERQGASRGAFWVFAAGFLLVALLVATQVFLAQRTRRIFNLPLLAATGLALVATFQVHAALLSSDEHLRSAKEDAFDSVSALWTARAVANDANADESRYLLDAQRAPTYQAHFFSKRDQIAARPPGVTYDYVAQAASQYLSEASRAGSDRLPAEFKGYLADELRNLTYPGEKDAAITTLRAFGQYVAVDGQIRALEQAGKHQDAVNLCIGTQPGQSDWAFAQFDQALGKVLQINESEFAKAVDASFAELANLELLAGGAALLVALLVVAGFYPRLSEYW